MSQVEGQRARPDRPHRRHRARRAGRQAHHRPDEAAACAEASRRPRASEFPDGIPAFGADALRFTFASLATHGRDINFDLKRCEGYRNFCNKLWNATRFVLMNSEGAELAAGRRTQPQTDAERWILARLAKRCRRSRDAFRRYRFDLAAQALYEFTWNEYCDWFLELAKPALLGVTPRRADSTRHTLLLRAGTPAALLHPLIPFVTEEIWHAVAPKLGIAEQTASAPSPIRSRRISSARMAPAAEADMEWLKAVVSHCAGSAASSTSRREADCPCCWCRAAPRRPRPRWAKFDSQIRFLARA